MRTLDFAGRSVPAIGLGTWYMGEGHAPRSQEADALRAGLDAGLVVVDTAEMYADGGAEEVVGETCVTDQVLYNLTRRRPELDPFPVAAEAGMSIMAYSPLEQARLFDAPGAEVLTTVARRHDATAAQVALAWTIRDGNVLAIPKTVDPARARENAAALELELTNDDLAELDRAFPAPARAVPLEML